MRAAISHVGAIASEKTNEEGVARVLWKPSKAGLYNVTVVFEGDDSYAPARVSKTVKVSSFSTKLLLDVKENVKVDEEVKVTVSLLAGSKPLSGKRVWVYVNGTLLGGGLTSDGKCAFTWRPHLAGLYKLYATFKGDKVYSSCFSEKVVRVSKWPVDMTVKGPQEVRINQTCSYLVTLTDEEGKPVAGVRVLARSPVIRGKVKETLTGEDGKALFRVIFTEKGVFVVIFEFQGNRKFSGARTSFRVRVLASNLTGEPLSQETFVPRVNRSLSKFKEEAYNLTSLSTLKTLKTLNATSREEVKAKDNVSSYLATFGGGEKTRVPHPTVEGERGRLTLPFRDLKSLLVLFTPLAILLLLLPFVVKRRERGKEEGEILPAFTGGAGG